MDNLLFMSNAAIASNQIVSLDEYRRARGMAGPQRSMRSLPSPAPIAPVWVYWVPVWVW
jgi:hypothetical protein